jgi:hypothetical protein
MAETQIRIGLLYMETTVGHGKDKRLEKENEGEQDHIYKN